MLILCLVANQVLNEQNQDRIEMILYSTNPDKYVAFMLGAETQTQTETRQDDFRFTLQHQ